MINRNSIIVILIIGMIVGYLMIPTKSATDDIVVKLTSMSFNSSKEDNSIMEVTYMLGVANNGSEKQKFQIKIKPKELEWFPYLHCIPEEYVSEVLEFGAGEARLFKLTTDYKSTETRNTNGHLSDQDLNVEIMSAN